MTLRTILVPAASRLDLTAPLDAALSIARPLRAHIDVVYASPSASIITAQVPEGASIGALDLGEIRRKARDVSERMKSRFQDWCAQNGIGHAPKDHLLGSTFARWSEEEQELAPGVAQWGRLADLIVVNRPKAFNVQSSQCFDGAVFAAGRPTLLVSGGKTDNPLRHILVAWNGSLEATHALALSIDLLHTAAQISIFSAPDGFEGRTKELDLAAALRWHGIEATCLGAPAETGSPGAALLETARAHNVSLILMGAYTHSPIREMLLGGVTRHVLDHAAIPVIMAH